MLLSLIKSLRPEREPLTEAEFRQIFNAHFAQVRNLIFYKYRDAELAEDMAQEAFARLWETRHNIERSTVRSYLYTISSNLAKNVMIRNAVRYKFEASRHVDDRDREAPDFLMESEDFKKRVDEALAGMSEGVREVFLMSRLEDMSYKEIAEVIQLSVKAVEKRIGKAKAHLREKLGVDL